MGTSASRSLMYGMGALVILIGGAAHAAVQEFKFAKNNKYVATLPNSNGSAALVDNGFDNAVGVKAEKLKFTYTLKDTNQVDIVFTNTSNAADLQEHPSFISLAVELTNNIKDNGKDQKITEFFISLTDRQLNEAPITGRDDHPDKVHFHPNAGGIFKFSPTPLSTVSLLPTPTDGAKQNGVQTIDLTGTEVAPGKVLKWDGLKIHEFIRVPTGQLEGPTNYVLSLVPIVTNVPEPSTYLLLGIGIGLLGIQRIGRRSKL